MAAARGLSSRPRNWCGSTVRPSASTALLAGAEGVQLVEHFAFEALHVFQRHVQEVRRAAGRVEHADLAQAWWKGVDFGGGGVGLPSLASSRAAACTFCHSPRSGSMTVGSTRRST